MRHMRRVLSQLVLTTFLHSLAYFFQLGDLEPNFKYSFIFLYSTNFQATHFSLVFAVKLVFGKLCFYEVLAGDFLYCVFMNAVLLFLTEFSCCTFSDHSFETTFI